MKIRVNDQLITFQGQPSIGDTAQFQADGYPVAQLAPATIDNESGTRLFTGYSVDPVIEYDGETRTTDYTVEDYRRLLMIEPIFDLNIDTTLALAIAQLLVLGKAADFLSPVSYQVKEVEHPDPLVGTIIATSLPVTAYIDDAYLDTAIQAIVGQAAGHQWEIDQRSGKLRIYHPEASDIEPIPFDIRALLAGCQRITNSNISNIKMSQKNPRYARVIFFGRNGRFALAEGQPATVSAVERDIPEGVQQLDHGYSETSDILVQVELIAVPVTECNYDVVIVIAGTGTAGYNGDSILATTAQLNLPTMAIRGPDGNYYIADTANHRVRRVIVSSGFIETVAGTGVAGNNGDSGIATAIKLDTPQGLAFDSSGRLLICDQNNNRIMRVDLGGNTIAKIYGTGIPGYNGDGIDATTAANITTPLSICLSPTTGDVFISEGPGHRIRSITASDNKIHTVIGDGTSGYNGDEITATTARVNQPGQVFLDASEDLLFGDQLNNRIRKITFGDGLVHTVAGTGTQGYNGDEILATAADLNIPFGVVVDTNGNIIISDSGNNSIRRVRASDLKIETVISSAEGLVVPVGIAIDPDDSLIVTDTLDSKIKLFPC